MDNKVTPLYPRIRMGVREPQLPILTPRDLAAARKQRAEARATRRRTPKFVWSWTAFVIGAMTNELVHHLRSLLP